MAKVTVTQEEFARRVKNRFPDEEFEILEYHSTGKSLKVRCCYCNDIIEVSKATNFLVKTKAYGCKNCHGL